MATCSNCGTETKRIKLRWIEGERQPDQCPHCCPESFEKFTVPSDKKIWMGYEAHPNEYEKKYDKDGVIYERKPEYRVEQENRLRQPTASEADAQSQAETRKRSERRTQPMDELELAFAMRRAEEIASFIVAAAAEGRDIN